MVNILLQFKGLKICKNIIVRNFHAINISLHFIKQMKTVTIYKLKKNSNIFFHVLRSFVSLDNQNKSGNSNHSLTHSLVESLPKIFRLLIWELMDATPTNNRSFLPRTTVPFSQNTPGCICLWALPSPCCQRFNRLFVWILPSDLPGLVRLVRSWSFCQYST